MRLQDTKAQNSFKYGYLLKRISKYILPYWDRILFNFLIAIPVGLLDGVVAYALRPYMDEVIGKGNEQLAFWIPFAIIFFLQLNFVFFLQICQYNHQRLHLNLLIQFIFRKWLCHMN